MSALSDALNEANVEQLSVREIARRSGDRVSHSQLGKYFKPDHPRPGEDVIGVFAEVFNIQASRLRELAGYPAGDLGPWTPPEEATRLDRRQRALMDELVRMLARPKRGDGDVDRDAASMTEENDDNVHQLPTAARRTRQPRGNPSVEQAGRDSEASQDPGTDDPS